MALDRFSTQADAYAKFRPVYPNEFISEVIGHCLNFEMAWDCATGNGQVASTLSQYFKGVEASDLSEKQLANASKKPNIRYSQQPAERTTYGAGQFDLITVAQAIHWFDRNDFFSEVDRVLKRDGILAVWGYGLFKFDNKELDDLIYWFYEDIMGKFWDPQRKLVEDQYKAITLPFTEINQPKFKINFEASVQDIINFFETWSSVANYRKSKNSDPIPLIGEKLLSKFDSNQKFSGHYPGFAKIQRKS